MFGLDARIALAIFGALSVISGAALYSAIQQSRYVSAATTLAEASKAIEAFMLDTGQDLSHYSGVGHNAKDLVSSSATGWAGPYVQYDTHATRTDILYISNFLGSTGTMHVYHCKAGLSNCVVCDGATNCEVWLKFMNYPESVYNALDDVIDNGDGLSAGRLRVRENTPDNAGSRLFYKAVETTLSQWFLINVKGLLLVNYILCIL